MEQRKIGEVFFDAENFPEPKRLRCAESTITIVPCVNCAYFSIGTICPPIDCIGVEFIETTEPLTKN